MRSGPPAHPRRVDGPDPLTWLRQGEVANTPTAILSALERRATLIGWGVDRWDLQALHTNRLKFLARLGKRLTNQALQRAPAERRYPTLVAFLRQALEETTDEVIDLFDRCLARASARAERKLEEFRLATPGRPMKRPGCSARSVASCSTLRSPTGSCGRRSTARSPGRGSARPWSGPRPCPVAGTTTSSTSWPTATTTSASSRHSSSTPSRSGPIGPGDLSSRPSPASAT